MSQTYRVLSANRMDGEDNHGNVSFWADFEDDEQTYTGVLVKQKPTSPEPSGEVFGRLEPQTSAKGNQYWRFRRERQEENGATPAKATPSRSDSGSPSPEFWAAKDRRLARAGMTQAVVASGRFNAAATDDVYVRSVTVLTDALLADLEQHTPSPNSPGTLGSPPSAGGAGGTGTSPPASGSGAAPTPGAAPSPDFTTDTFAIALVASGVKDVSNPQAAFYAMQPAQQKQVLTKLAELDKTGVTQMAQPAINDDEDIPF